MSEVAILILMAFINILLSVLNYKLDNLFSSGFCTAIAVSLIVELTSRIRLP